MIEVRRGPSGRRRRRSAPPVTSNPPTSLRGPTARPKLTDLRHRSAPRNAGNRRDRHGQLHPGPRCARGAPGRAGHGALRHGTPSPRPLRARAGAGPRSCGRARDSIVPAVMRTVNEPVPDLGAVPDAPIGLMAVDRGDGQGPRVTPGGPRRLGGCCSRSGQGPVLDRASTPGRRRPRPVGRDRRRRGAMVPGSASAPPWCRPGSHPGTRRRGGTGPRRGVVVGAIAGGCLVTRGRRGGRSCWVAATARRTGGGATTTTSAVERDDGSDPTAMTELASSEAGEGSKGASAPRALGDSVDQYVELADRLLADPSNTELQAQIAGSPVRRCPEAAVTLAQSGLSAEEQVRYQGQRRPDGGRPGLTFRLASLVAPPDAAVVSKSMAKEEDRRRRSTRSSSRLPLNSVSASLSSVVNRALPRRSTGGPCGRTGPPRRVGRCVRPGRPCSRSLGGEGVRRLDGVAGDPAAPAQVVPRDQGRRHRAPCR